MRKIGFLGAILLLHSCSDINKELNLPDDNHFEEMLEMIIQNETGLQIDLTP